MSYVYKLAWSDNMVLAATKTNAYALDIVWQSGNVGMNK